MATMFCKRMAGIHKKGREHLAELRETHRAESERLMGVFGDVLSVVREAVTGPGPDPAVEGSAARDGSDVRVGHRTGGPAGAEDVGAGGRVGCVEQCS